MAFSASKTQARNDELKRSGVGAREALNQAMREAEQQQRQDRRDDQ